MDEVVFIVYVILPTLLGNVRLGDGSARKRKIVQCHWLVTYIMMYCDWVRAQEGNSHADTLKV